jgi:cytoskeletal protein RodZ
MPALVEPVDPGKELPVEPGKEAVARFSVRNTGDDVNNFTFRILGEPSRWHTGIRVVGDPRGERQTEDGPPVLDLLPNENGEVEVTFRPPTASDTAAGLVPYGLLVCSYATRDDKPEEEVEAVEAGLLNVARFHRFVAQLLPRTSRGRFSGKHRLAVDNYGNSPATASFLAEDAENLLEVRFSPKTLLVEPGTAGFTKVKLKPRRKFLLGPPRAAPFKIFVAFERGTVKGETVPIESGEQVPPVDGLYMQRSVLPPLLLPIAALVIAGVILWAIFRPQPEVTAGQLAAAQQAADANALTEKSINVAHQDAVAARKQAARQAALARKDAQQTQQQVAQAASAAQEDAEQMQQQAAKATSAAAAAGATANNAARTAAKALQAATPPFAGTPFGQQLALPADCTPSCTSPQPFTAQPFAAQTFYVTDVRVGNPGNGKGTLTLTLGGKPVLIEPLANVTGANVKPSTPLLVQGGEALAARVSCAEGPCTPSVFVSGFHPAKPPDPTGPNGKPTWKRLSRSCQPPSTCAVMTVPAAATSYELTDVIFQNPAGDAGTITLSRGARPLLVEGLDPSSAGALPITFAAPIVLMAREKLTLTVRCSNSGGRSCTPGALLIGVLKLR